MRKTYYWNRETQRMEEARPADGPVVRTQLIMDDMDACKHPASGTVYTSKSKFRAETRARGLTEVGNEYVGKPKEYFAPQPKFADPMPVLHELARQFNK